MSGLGVQPNVMLGLVAEHLGVPELKGMTQTSKLLHVGAEWSRNKRMLRTQKQQWSLLYPEMGENFTQNETVISLFGVHTQKWKEGEEKAWCAAYYSLPNPIKKLTKEEREAIARRYLPKYHTYSKEFGTLINWDGDNYEDEIAALPDSRYINQNNRILTAGENMSLTSVAIDMGCSLREILEIFTLDGGEDKIVKLLDVITFDNKLSTNEHFLLYSLFTKRCCYLTNRDYSFSSAASPIITRITLLHGITLNETFLHGVILNLRQNLRNGGNADAKSEILTLQIVYDNLKPEEITGGLLTMAISISLKLMVEFQKASPQSMETILLSRAHALLLRNSPKVKELYDRLKSQ